MGINLESLNRLQVVSILENLELENDWKYFVAKSRFHLYGFLLPLYW